MGVLQIHFFGPLIALQHKFSKTFQIFEEKDSNYTMTFVDTLQLNCIWFRFHRRLLELDHHISELFHTWLKTFSVTSSLPIHIESENVVWCDTSMIVTQPIRVILMFNVDKEQTIGPVRF